MTSADDLLLVSSPDGSGLYDRFGNRYVFTSHRDYTVTRYLQIINWITRGKALCFL